MNAYPKIETLYNRDVTGTKKLIEGFYRSKTVEMLAHLPIWDCYEKVDGSNHQISWDGHRLTLLGRTEDSSIPSHIKEFFDSKFDNNETEEVFEQLFGNRSMVLFFEAIGKKVQKYGAKYGDSVRYVLLDVYNVNNDSWWDYDGIVSVAKAFNVECKLQIDSGVTLDKAIDIVKDKRLSLFAQCGDLPMEGLVCVPHVELKDANGERVIVKIKGCDFCSDWASYMKQYR